jgi:ribosomal protein S18 acetylase RimI-like enzyme
MLRHAFDVAATQGYDDVILHVDSSNEHDAPSVYRRAGFEVRCAFNAFSCTLDATDAEFI